jgi:hypothetical protein
MLSAVISAGAGAYLVATFTATGLAKLRSRRAAAAGLISENVIAPAFAAATVVGISAIELILALLCITDTQTFAIGIFAAALFLSFGAYRVLSTIRTGRVSCSCTGAVRSSQVTVPDILGALSASLTQAAIACAWALSSPPSQTTLEVFLALVALIPLTAFCAGIISGIIRMPDPGQ